MKILYKYTFLLCVFIEAPAELVSNETRKEIVLTALGALSGGQKSCGSVSSHTSDRHPGDFPPFKEYAKGSRNGCFRALDLTPNVFVVPLFNDHEKDGTENFAHVYIKYGSTIDVYRIPFPTESFSEENAAEVLIELFKTALGHLETDTGSQKPTDAHFLNPAHFPGTKLEAYYSAKVLQQYNAFKDLKIFQDHEPYTTWEWWVNVHKWAVGALLYGNLLEFAITEDQCVVKLNPHTYLLAPGYVSETEMGRIFQSARFIDDHKKGEKGKEFTVLYKSEGGAYYPVEFYNMFAFIVFTWRQNPKALPGQEYQPCSYYTTTGLVPRVDYPIDDLVFARHYKTEDAA